MKRIAIWGALALFALTSGVVATPKPVGAQERNTIYFLGDYERFTVGRNQTWRACRRACGRDPRCRAWTFIRATRQCRLKYFVGPKAANNCCISGKRPRPVGQSRQLFCSDYAVKAVEAQERNLAERCGYTGPRWSSSFGGHYRWCLRANPRLANRETEARAAALERCTSLAGRLRKARCEHYTRLAVEQSRTNEKARCGFEGPLWNLRPAYHRRRCENEPFGVTRDKFFVRERRLRRCFALGGSVNRDCRRFARQAVRDFERAVANRCGFGVSQRWNDIRRRHYRWCVDASPRERRREERARTRQLEQCLARASKRRVCNEYADQALVQVRQNRDKDCGFTGPRWRLSRTYHFNFCMDASRAEREAAADDRAAALERCSLRLGKRRACNRYADKAMAAVSKSTDLGCGYTGPRWSANRRRHFNFCMDATVAERDAEEAQRERAIGRCEVKAERCRRYARNALAQVRRAEDEGCDFTGPRWSTSLSAHQSFCMRATPEERRAERRARRRELDSCVADFARCGTYAREAVAQAKRAKDLACGYTGPRWSTSLAVHLQFCRRNDAATLADVRRFRERRLERCELAQSTPRDPACDRYAKRALRAQRINLEQECGYTNRIRWSSDYDHHYNYCLETDRLTRREQNRRRRRALVRCSLRKGFTLDF